MRVPHWRPAVPLDETMALTAMAGLVPAIHVVQSRRSLLWRAACKPNRVDGRDKPGHDGKWHGNQRLTRLFLVGISSVSPSPARAKLSMARAISS